MHCLTSISSPPALCCRGRPTHFQAQCRRYHSLQADALLRFAAKQKVGKTGTGRRPHPAKVKFPGRGRKCCVVFAFSLPGPPLKPSAHAALSVSRNCPAPPAYRADVVKRAVPPLAAARRWPTLAATLSGQSARAADVHLDAARRSVPPARRREEATHPDRGVKRAAGPIRRPAMQALPKKNRSSLATVKRRPALAEALSGRPPHAAGVPCRRCQKNRSPARSREEERRVLSPGVLPQSILRPCLFPGRLCRPFPVGAGPPGKGMAEARHAVPSITKRPLPNWQGP